MPSRHHEWWLSTRTLAGKYAYDREWFIVRAKVIMIHAPGHIFTECVVIPGAGHDAMFTKPDEYNKVLESFLQSSFT